ncbi:unnamed protein product [Urochloa humidicola]
MVMATSRCKVMLLMAFIIAAALTTVSRAQSPLQYNFYGNSCPQAEATVRNVTEGIIVNDRTMGAAFVRLFFHDCFGCDASILLDPTSSNPQVEKKAITLRGYDAVNKIKAAVESVCPGVVSCADILAFAARDTAIVSGGFASFDMPSGRRDGVVSNFFDVLQNIPSPILKLQDLINNFAAKGLSVDDLVALRRALLRPGALLLLQWQTVPDRGPNHERHLRRCPKDGVPAAGQQWWRSGCEQQ